MNIPNNIEGLAEFVKLKIKKMESADREKTTKFRQAILDTWIVDKMQKHKKNNYDLQS